MLSGKNEIQKQLAHHARERSQEFYLDDLKKLLGEMLRSLETIGEQAQFKLDENFNLSEQVRRYEADLIRYALRLTKGNQKAAAHLLGINYTTLNIKVKRYGLVEKAN